MSRWTRHPIQSNSNSKRRHQQSLPRHLLSHRSWAITREMLRCRSITARRGRKLRLSAPRGHAKHHKNPIYCGERFNVPGGPGQLNPCNTLLIFKPYLPPYIAIKCTGYDTKYPGRARTVAGLLDPDARDGVHVVAAAEHAHLQEHAASARHFRAVQTSSDQFRPVQTIR